MKFFDYLFSTPDSNSMNSMSADVISKKIFDLSPEAILLINKQGLIVDANNRISEWLGINKTSIVNKRFLDLPFIHKQSKKIANENFHKRLKGETVSPYEMKLFSDQKSDFYVRINASAIKDKSGNIIGEIVMASDINEAKRITFEEEAVYNDIKKLSQSAIGFVEMGKGANIYNFIGEQLKSLIGDCYIIVNRYIAENSSTTTEAIIGASKRAESFLKGIKAWPIGKEYKMGSSNKAGLLRKDLVHLKEGLYELYAGGMPISTTRVMERVFKVGEIYTMGFSWEGVIYGNAVIITKKGTKIRRETLEAFLHQASVALQKRKTDEEIQKAKEELEKRVKERTKDLELSNQELEKFKLAVDDASDTILIADTTGKVVYANLAAKSNSNYQFIVENHKTFNLFELNYSESDYQGIKNKLEKEKKAYIELHNKDANGINYYSEIYISSVTDSKGKAIFYVWIERDITRAKEVDQAKTEFVSLASHQLRTPLSAINWYTEMLMAGDAGDVNLEQKNYLEEIYKGSQRMVDLVNALLNVSRLELGTFVIEPIKGSLQKISDEVLEELKNQINSKKLQIIKKYNNSIPALFLDLKLTRIVFQNLLSNSVKYTPEGGSISVVIDINPRNKQEILVMVKDSGYGIPRNQQDKVFSKLFRADNVKKMETEGTGLGLYIIKQIITHVGGSIWFDSVVDKGTTFYVTIPIDGMKKKEGVKELS